MNLLILSCLLLFPQDPAKQGKGQQINRPAAQGVDKVLPNQIEYFQAIPPLSLEQAINQALSNHPDIRLAEAELRVAEAKVAQARSSVSQKVAEEFQQLEKDKMEVERATSNWERMTKLLSSSAISQSEYKEVQVQLANAKARLATTEQKWNMMMGKANNAVTDNARLLYQYYGQPYVNLTKQFNPVSPEYFNMVTPDTIHLKYNVVTGSITDQLKNSLEAKVKLEKQTNIGLEKVFEKVTEGAGLKVRVKLPVTENPAIYKEVTKIDLDPSEFPLHTWLQLIVDEMNNQQAMMATKWKESPKRFELYVREYGLLLTSRDLAPSDAITVQDLLKQVRQEKAAKDAKKTESTTPRK